MKHKRLTIILTCLVFVAVCIVSLLQLFSVKDISVVYSVTGEESMEDVLTILEKYKGKNMFFVNTEEIKEDITKDKYLKVMSVEKKYPNELVINVSQRMEVYGYKADDGYYFMDEDYFIVRKSDVKDNDQVIMFNFETIDGEEKKVSCELKKNFVFPENLNDKADTCFALFKDERYNVFHNIQSAGITFTTEKGNYRLDFLMDEGVIIEIRNASESIEEKMEKGIIHYLSLEEDRKIDGTIIVDTMADGSIVAKHTRG